VIPASDTAAEQILSANLDLIGSLPVKRLIKALLRRAFAPATIAQDPPTPSVARNAPTATPPPPVREPEVPFEGLPVVRVEVDGSTPYLRRERFIITELVYFVLLPNETFSILDGGARGGPSDPRWRSIGDDRLVIYGFEVEDEECETLNRDAAARGLRHHYYPRALWSSEGPLTIYLNKASGGVSAFAQNVDLTNRWKFQNAKDKFYSRDIFYPIGETTVPATTVDEWARKNNVAEIDFFKLNVQSAELEILKGARDILGSVLGLELEMSFVESYLGRPFFSDLDVFLRGKGFHFFDLLGLHNMGRAHSPVTSMHTPGLNPYQGQLIEAHGLYFRDPIASKLDLSAGPTPSKLLKLASVAEIYGQVEYAFELLGWLPDRLDELGRGEEARRIRDVRDAAFRLYQRYLWAPAV
jgi:FkbM family methyltransferase